MSDFLGHHELQQARLPCPSLSLRVCSDSCPLSQWCNPSVSSSVIPFSSCPQSFPASGSDEPAICIRWPKYWSFSFSISPSYEYSGLIFFSMDWFDLLAVQVTHKSVLQQHTSKAFYIVQLLHPFMTTGKIITLTTQTFVSKVMSLFFNMLSRSVRAFLPRSKCLLISWLQSPSAVVFEPE